MKIQKDNITTNSGQLIIYTGKNGGVKLQVDTLALSNSIMYNMYTMKIITTTSARKNISKLINRVKYSGEIFGIGRRNSVDAILMRFPESYNKEFNEITNINADSASFDFLENEPDMYSLSDLKKRYV